MASITKYALTPKAIRKAIKARLIAFSVAGGNVFSTRPRPTEASEAPAVNVFSPGGGGTNRSKHIPALDADLNIVCVGTVVIPGPRNWAAVDEALGDAVDDLEYAIKDAILSDGSLIASLEVASAISEKGFDTSGESYRGVVKVMFTFRYRESYEIRPVPPTVYDNLEVISAEFDIDGDGDLDNEGAKTVTVKTEDLDT